jgi:hypothetical protein
MSVEQSPGSFIGIYESFAETEPGMLLASRIRYERYKPVDVSDARWQELLGADVNNLKHALLTRNLTRSMLSHLRVDRPQLLSENEGDILEVMAFIHDFGEGVGIDITYSDKTEDDSKKEMLDLKDLLDKYYGESSPEIATLMEDAFDVLDGNDFSGLNVNKLGKIFNTVERVGYLRTALRAAKHIEDGTAPDCEDGFSWIIADVFGNQLGALIERAREYPCV